MPNYRLLSQIAKNDLRVKYQGSVVGRLWLVITPLFMLLLYSLVFSVIFKARWESLGVDVYASYAIVLFPGLMMYQVMMEALTKGATAYETYAPMTSKINISAIYLILGTTLASLIPFWITIAIWYLVVSLLVGLSLQGFLLVTLITFIFSIFCVGLVLLSSVIGALLKDWAQVLSMLGMGLLFVSPVLYPVDHLPDAFQQVIYLNPLSHFVDIIRIGAFEPTEALTTASLIPPIAMTIAALLSGFWLERVLERFLND